MFEEDSKTIYNHPVYKLTRKSFICDVCKEQTYYLLNRKTFTYYNIVTTFNNGTEWWNRSVDCCDLDCVSSYIKSFNGDPDFNRCYITKEEVLSECYSIKEE